MFDEFVYVSLLEEYNQKCYLSPQMALSVRAYVGDYISIRCPSGTVICKLFLKNNISFVQLDTTVTSERDFDTSVYSTAYFPEDFTPLQAVVLNRIKINIIFKDTATLVEWGSNDRYLPYVKALLYQYGVIAGSYVNCEKHLLGRTIGISKIHVLDIYQDIEMVGKVGLQTVLEVQFVESEESYLKKKSLIKLGGLNSQIQSLKSLIRFYSTIKKNKKFPGTLLIGPSGCGKSSLIKILAFECTLPLISVRVVELYLMSVSECKNFFNLVQQAGERSSDDYCIIFLDDIDAAQLNKTEQSKALYITLALLDMCKKYYNLIVLGAAISSKSIHPYLKRPDRFVREVHIGVPNLEQRESILEILTENMISCAADLKEIAKETPGYVGADLSFLVLNAETIAYEKKDNDEINAMSDKLTITTADFKDALRFVKPSLLKESNFTMDVQPIHWDDIGGLESVKKRAKMYVEWPVLYPSIFSKVGLPCPKGVLLYGPPGCCKTTLVRVLATECKATFFSASPAQIYTAYVGESEKSVVELFRQARLCTPSIIFLDEIESLVGKRSYSGSYRGIQEKVLSTLLNEMDGFSTNIDYKTDVMEKVEEGNSKASDQELIKEIKSNENVLVVGATNRIDLIDDALLRPGRFDTILYVPPPNLKERKAILKTISKKMELEDELLEWLAGRTEYYSGADLKNLCRIAGLNAIKSSLLKVTKEHFESALKLTHPSIAESHLKNYERLASKYGAVITT